MSFKKVTSLFLAFICTTSLFCYEVTYRYIFYNGNSVQKTVDDYIETLVLTSPNNGVKRIDGLQQLKNVRELRLYNLQDVDLSFIKHFDKLEEIFFYKVKPETFNHISNKDGLNVLSVNNGVDGELLDKINKGEDIDLSSFTNLEVLVFEGFNPKLTKVPHFIIPNSKVKLSMINSNISSFSESDIEILKQFNTIDISYSPVCENEKEIKKLEDANIIYIAKKEGEI